MPKLSAGLLPYKFAEDGSLAVLLVHPGGPFWKNKDAHAWSIPKGEYQEGEDPEQAAEREFAEELGLPVPDGPRIDLGTIRQASGKYVRAWAVRTEHLVTDAVVSNCFEMEWPPKSGTMTGVSRGRSGRVDDDQRSHHPAGGGPSRSYSAGYLGIAEQHRWFGPVVAKVSISRSTFHESG